MVVLSIYENFIGPVGGILVAWGIGWLLKKLGWQKGSTVFYVIAFCLVLWYLIRFIKSCTS